jgi:hypothetical protein
VLERPRCRAPRRACEARGAPGSLIDEVVGRQGEEVGEPIGERHLLEQPPGVVEPVELAQALQRESADKKAILGPGRVLVPNDYVVELGQSDYDRLAPYAEPLGAELASMVRENADEQGWSFVGPVRVRLEETDLDTGVFRVRSDVAPGNAAAARAAASAPAGDRDGERDRGRYERPGRPGYARLVITADGSDDDDQREQVLPLTKPVTVLGRAADVDIPLDDAGVSRRHAEIHVTDGRYRVVDLGSTNGTFVDGERIATGELRDGSTITVGRSRLVFRLGQR